MGLQEKRRIKMLQDEVLPRKKEEVKELCGADIEWEIDWESLSDDMPALDNFESQGIQKVIEVLYDCCCDDIGKEAVAAGLKKIILKNHKDPAMKKNVFKDGVLEVHAAWGASWDGYPENYEIKQVLEGGL